MPYINLEYEKPLNILERLGWRIISFITYFTKVKVIVPPSSGNAVLLLDISQHILLVLS
jgi:hypothetical protein